ncbi:hypothetical protein V5O48_001734 [Marasmius crinis-equi]|uniref:Uncharacterized protein n=1 Tax=Marasmius crinis-equi TaxID=585013 RepID=A0ABR3FY95_9AGAR
MVGIFGASAKQHHHPSPRRPNSARPPPEYRESDSSPVIFSETTVTTTEVVTTTTQTTTHFFSLPLWKRRAPPSSHVSPLSISKPEMAVEATSTPRSASFKIDKALPPTPQMEPANGSTYFSPSRRPSTEESTEGSKKPLLLLPNPSGSKAPPMSRPSSSTAALAHAALGLGLPHVLPHASTSSSDVNTIAFSSSSSEESPVIPDDTPARRAKGRAVSTFARPEQTDSSKIRNRKTRGLSLGPASFLSFGGSEAKEKGKEKETVPEVTVSPTKSLVRKSSFWSRRKDSSGSGSGVPLPSTKPPSQLPPPSKDLFVPLPAFTPISPFNMNLSTPPGDRQSHHSRGLSRSKSHSDRVGSGSSRHPPQTAEGEPPPPRRRASRRPSTADASSSPGTSRFIPGTSGPLTASPLSTPPPTTNNSFEVAQAQQPARTTSEFLRPRASTNPPFLHRLSMNIFSSSPAPPLPASPSLPTPPTRSSTSKRSIEIPKPQVDEETPQVYLKRLQAAVSKSEIAGILASTTDPFHIECLKMYISQFDFEEDPLDVALRRLLMDVGLPRETQQIDRVMEAFASRYHQSHAGLFTSEDHPYVLAFSLIMLHTDAFNKSNKRKMTKADYIKNTRLPGVPPEVLDCFYDNIVFAPFIFVEDPVDVNGQRGLVSDGTQSRISIGTSTPPTVSGGGSMILGKANNKVDPYYLISNNLLGPLRVDVETHVPLEEPYSYEGTRGPWDENELLRSFAQPSVVKVGPDPARATPAIFSLTVAGGPPSPMVGIGSPPLDRHHPPESAKLRVTKAGVLNRKDDILMGGKKASSRKWRPWTVILTGSQLLLFRDPAWANSLFSEHLSLQTFKPDELLSVKDCIAVFDKSYVKHESTFRFVMPDGRHILWGASTEEDMNQWISRINYASTFKSTGVRMRPLGMSGRDVHLTGVAAATSHLHDLQYAQGHPRVKNWDKDSSRDLMGMLVGDSSPSSAPVKKPQARRVTIASGVVMDSPEAPEVEGADQFIATFDQVKADLAAGRSASPDGLLDDVNGIRPSFERSYSTPVPQSDSQRIPSRSRVVLSKVESLESKISVSQTQLDTDMRFVKNIAALTPFQRTTRDRLIVAVQGAAKRIMQTRLDIAKLSCHRDVLFRDLAAETQDWSRAKKQALRVATETLQSQQQQNVVGGGDSSTSVPRMTLSFHETEPNTSESVSLPSTPYTPSPPSLHRRESTAGSVQSFHSALEDSPEWLTTDDVDVDTSASDLLGIGDNSRAISLDSIRNGSSGIWHENEAPQDSLDAVVDGVQSPRTSEDVRTHEKFYTAQDSEEAEEWNKTRCAQRVSLVRMPSVLEYGKLRTNTINE